MEDYKGVMSYEMYSKLKVVFSEEEINDLVKSLKLFSGLEHGNGDMVEEGRKLKAYTDSFDEETRDLIRRTARIGDFMLELSLEEDAKKLQELTRGEQYKRPIIKSPNYSIMLSKASNRLAEIDSTAGIERPVRVGQYKGTDKDLAINVQFVLDNENTKLSAPLTKFDEQVLKAVCSLVHNGYYVFSLKQLYAEFSCKTGEIQVRPETLEKFDKSVEKLMSKVIKIDATEQYREWGIDLNKKRAIKRGNLLAVNSVILVNPDGTLDNAGYKVVSKPLILEYCEEIDQIADVPKNLLKLNVKDTPENRTMYYVLRFQILRELASMPNKKRTYQNIFARAGIDYDSLNRKQQEREAEYLHRQLQGLVDDGVTFGDGKIKFVGFSDYESFNKNKKKKTRVIDFQFERVNTNPHTTVTKPPYNCHKTPIQLSQNPHTTVTNATGIGEATEAGNIGE